MIEQLVVAVSTIILYHIFLHAKDITKDYFSFSTDGRYINKPSGENTMKDQLESVMEKIQATPLEQYDKVIQDMYAVQALQSIIETHGKLAGSIKEAIKVCEKYGVKK